MNTLHNIGIARIEIGRKVDSVHLPALRYDSSKTSDAKCCWLTSLSEVVQLGVTDGGREIDKAMRQRVPVSH